MNVFECVFGEETVVEQIENPGGVPTFEAQVRPVGRSQAKTHKKH